MKRLFVISTILLSSSAMSLAQDTNDANNPHTVRSSFDKMLKESNRYQDFKVVKRVRLDAFIVEVQDSLDLVRGELNSELGKTRKLQAEIDALNGQIQSGQEEVSNLQGQRDSIESMGMVFDKNSFSTFMWIAVLTLLGLLIAVFLRNKSMASSQKGIKKHLQDLEDQLTGAKKKALEREQELKREIQDYVNKIEAMGPPR